MKKLLILLLVSLLQFPVMMKADNVFLHEFKTTNGLIPFDYFTNADFEPAIMEGIKEQNKEIASIVNQRSMPTFENTIVALEKSGETLNRTLYVFYAMLSSNADDELMSISQKLSPILSDHNANISLNEKLWERIKFVYDNCDKSKLSNEDKMLLTKTYEDFVSRRVLKLIRNDIACYAMHTNYDVLGMAALAERILGIRNTQVLDVTKSENGVEEGIGRVGDLEKPLL